MWWGKAAGGAWGEGGVVGIVQKTGVPIMIERETFETKKWKERKEDYNSVTRIQLVMIDVAAR